MNSYTLKYYFFTLSLICLFSSCLTPDEFSIDEQRNQGFLSYDSGLGVTSGVKILPYSTDTDSGYILLGNTDTGLDENYFLVKTDTKGRILASVSFGDLDADNEAVDMIIEDDYIFVLGSAYDKNLDRVIPATTAFSLDGLLPENFFNVNFATPIDTSGATQFIYEEKSDAFIYFEEEKAKIVVSTVLDVFDKNLGKVYLIGSDFGFGGSNDIKSVDLIVIDTTSIPMEVQADVVPGDKISFVMGGVKKMPTNQGSSFIVGATISIKNWNDSLKTTYFYLAQYSIQQDQLIRTNEWYYKTPDKNQFEAFEILSENPTRLMILSAEDNYYYGDLYELPQNASIINSWYDFIDFGPNKQAGKSANLSKIVVNGKTHLFVTTVKSDNGLYVERLELDDNLKFVRPWYAINGGDIVSLSLWNSSQSFNNIWTSASSPDGISYFPSLAYNKQLRNNVGNVVPKWGDDQGFCIIGTHDFLDLSKMVMMQIDANGEYILE